MTAPSNDEPTIVDVVRVLRVTYTDQGVLIWLNSANTQFPWDRSPAAMIQDGRIAEVYEIAQRIEGGH